MSDPTPNVERFARLEALFHEALEKPAAERAAFLDARCAGDAGLRAEIDRWLRGHDAAGSLFLRPAAEEPALPDLVGRQIGRYRIDRLIAAGGMGVVYEATQEAPHRTVAIKLLRRGLATASERRRFELEAEILARVRHPAVAQVLEAGTTQEGGVAVPWFALELVPGARPITDYANEKRLSVRERLLLFAEVCDAVAHGHANGIVHRDIKPGNVLVDSSGRPKVIDFGVARVFDSDLALGTRLTSESHVLGTLEYMSPEQCVGDSDGVDVRSDVYSLGVLLYELVCGTLPFALRDKSLGESLRIVREDPPRRPSSIRRELSGDLEAIVLKAIAKERERRYASANELVEDVRRFLRREPVTARLPSVSYGIRVFARRHRVLVGAIVAVGVVLVAGVIVSSRFAFRANRAALAAENARGALATEQEDTLRMLGFLRSLLAEGDPLRPAPSGTVAELLDSAAVRLDREFDGRPLLQAPLRVTLGRAYVNLARFEDGQRQLEAALASLTGSDAATRRLRLEALVALATARMRLLRAADAKATAEEAIRVAAELGEPESEAALQARNLLGTALESLGALAEAEAVLAENLAVRRRLSAPRSIEIADSASNLASVLHRRARTDEAKELWTEALEIYRSAGLTSNPNTATILGNLAIVHLQQGDLEAARSMARESVDLQRARLGPDHPDLASAIERLGLVDCDIGNARDAEDEIRESLRIRKVAYGDANPRVAQSLSNLGFVLVHAGRHADAIAILEEALAIQKKALAPDHLDVGSTLLVLGIALTRFGEAARAEVLLQECLRIRSRLGESHWHYQNARSALGECLAALHRPREAEPLLVDSEVRVRAALGKRHPRAVEARQRVVAFYESEGRESDAARYRTSE